MHGYFQQHPNPSRAGTEAIGSTAFAVMVQEKPFGKYMTESSSFIDDLLMSDEAHLYVRNRLV